MPLAYGLGSLALLIPCFWRSRIQAGDLASHLYNAWLAQLIEAGKTQGLVIVRQTTNVLFDLLLSALFRAFGPGPAQRIAVAFCVLVFAWGAFAFASALAERRPWPMLPAIAVLAYGWVFHMGLFNFYLSLGFCFWALALAWNPSPRRLASATVFLVLAYAAHGLPLAFAVAVLAYVYLARRMDPAVRWRLVAAAFAALFGLRLALGSFTQVRWSPAQLIDMIGADQAWVFDDKYKIALVALLVAWTLLFVNLLHQCGGRKLIAGIPFQLCLLTAAGIFFLPTGISIPGYRHALVFIAERMSLAVGVLICALLASARARTVIRYAPLAVALLFFGFLYRDEGVLNSIEDRIQAAAFQAPPFQRVVSGVEDSSLRVNALTHMIDRACIGRCYSYANYEPSTAQFRIQAVAPNPFVISDYADSWRLQNGLYAVKPADLPLYQVFLDDTGHMLVRSLPAGYTNGGGNWRFLE